MSGTAARHEGSTEDLGPEAHTPTHKSFNMYIYIHIHRHIDLCIYIHIQKPY